MMQITLPEKLRMLRTRQGLTLEEAAERTRVTRETLGLLERGKRRPHAPTLHKIAKGYGVPVEELLGTDIVESPLEEHAVSPKGEAVISPELSEAADEKRHPVLDTLSPLLSYMEKRAKAYEEELEDQNSPHFRNADAAVEWVLDLNQEARALSWLLIEEAKPHMKSIDSTKEKARVAVGLLRHIGTLFSVSRQASPLIEAMRNKPDELELLREKMETEQRESEARFYEELQFSHG